MILQILRKHIALLVLIVCSFIITSLFVQRISLFYNLLNSGVLIAIFLFSWGIVNYKRKEFTTRVVANYLIMTTFRFLSFLVYVLVLLSYKVDKAVVYQALIVCVCLLILQTIQLTKAPSQTP